MAQIIKYLKVIRNNWKKSAFAAGVLAYGYNYTYEYFEIQNLMRVYCEKAAHYGREPISADANPKTITVILNPNANKRRCTKEFEKYCAPILHLAGVSVDIVKTESEGHAKTLMETVNSTDAILVAGGDGTLSEVVTGLLRRTDENTNALVPLGVLPLGRTNTVATNLFPGGRNIQHVRSLVDAALAVVEEATKPVDVLRIEVRSDEEGKENKPVYALSGIKWGAYRDAETKKDKYWYFGFFRKYATYLFNGFKDSLSWKCEAELDYYLPCQGCTNCVVSKEQEPKNLFHRIIRSNKSSSPPLPENPQCKNICEKKVCTADLVLQTCNVISESAKKSDTTPRLFVNIGPKNVDYFEFVRQGWLSENGEKRDFEEVVEAREVILTPATSSTDNRELWFSIDNENFEVKPIKVTLLPRCLKMFCKKEVE